MKAKKLIAMIAFAGLGCFAQGAFAQGNEQTEQTTPPPPPATDENAATTGQETAPYNETVTIDSGSTTPGGTSEAGISEQAEKKEKLRVYSGKHDGNNVISDPR